MTRKWGNTVWKQLGDGRMVNVPEDVDPCLVEVHLADGTTRSYPMCKTAEVVGVTVDNRAYVPSDAAGREHSCNVNKVPYEDDEGRHAGSGMPQTRDSDGYEEKDFGWMTD